MAGRIFLRRAVRLDAKCALSLSLVVFHSARRLTEGYERFPALGAEKRLFRVV